MTRGPFGATIAGFGARIVRRTNRIVGAESTQVPRFPQVVPQATTFLDEPPKGSFATCGSRRQQQRCHIRSLFATFFAAIDPFANGACSIPALEADGREQ